MQSPFPGMDPFIEGYKWSTFHVNMITQIQRQLIDQLPAQYLLEVEEGVDAKDLIIGATGRYRPDVAIFEGDTKPDITNITSAAGTITKPTVSTTLPSIKQRTLTIRDSLSQELVTAIEVLSPTNKKGVGLTKYRQKRAELLRNQVNLVEIDLLREGDKPDAETDLPDSTYRVEAINAILRTVDAWCINLQDRLPTVSVPLLPKDQVLLLDLQEIAHYIYRYTSYSRSLTYDLASLAPPPTEEERAIISELLNQ